MHERLHDLRLLYLAHQVEETFETLERAFERHLSDPLVKEALKPIFQGGPGHARLEAELARLNTEMAAREQELSPRDILLALLDCERLAEGFYRAHASDLHDPKLADLFRTLGDEERRHLLAVEQALKLAG